MGETEILIQNEDIFLREPLHSDVEVSLKWKTSGEWRYTDAPWEGIDEKLTKVQEEDFRSRFIKFVDAPKVNPRKGVYICLNDGTPIGRATRYGNERYSDVFYLGIDICEDNYLDKGYGTQAMKSWID